MPTMEPTASDDCKDDDDDDKRHEQAMRTKTKTTITNKTCILEDHRFLDERRVLDEIAHLAETMTRDHCDDDDASEDCKRRLR